MLFRRDVESGELYIDSLHQFVQVHPGDIAKAEQAARVVVRMSDTPMRYEDAMEEILPGVQNAAHIWLMLDMRSRCNPCLGPYNIVTDEKPDDATLLAWINERQRRIRDESFDEENADRMGAVGLDCDGS